MRKYIKQFFKEDEGVETMEWIAILTVTVMLIAIGIAVKDSVEKKLSQAASYI